MRAVGVRLTIVLGLFVPKLAHEGVCAADHGSPSCREASADSDVLIQRKNHLTSEQVEDLIEDSKLVKDTGFHIITITDCSVHQKWMVHTFFSSAHAVGQDDPMTWVRANCPEQKNQTHDEERLLRSLYPKAELIDVQVKGPMPDKSWIKPAAMQAFIDSKRGVPEETMVALTDPDMIFLTKFRTHDLANRSIPAHDNTKLSKGFSLDPTRDQPFVHGLVGVAQHYLCCEGIGAPYVLTAEAWRALTLEWEKLRLASGGKEMGWGSEQNAFSIAAMNAGVKFHIYDHFMVSVPDSHAPGEGNGWVASMIQRGLGNTCATGLVGEASLLDKSDANPMPTFLHVVRPWGIQRMGWMYSKYQVPPGWSKSEDTDGILECSMPLLAEPPHNFELLAQGETEKLNAWGLCTITHSLNTMLRKFKTARCGVGFNSAPALKYKDAWLNEILPGGTDAVPDAGKAWVKNCANHCSCSL